MAKYCGLVSVGAVAGGGSVSTSNDYATTTIPIAVELIGFRVGEQFFRKIRLCQEFVSQFIHPGDNACIYVYKQLGITNVIVGVKSAQFPSYSISFSRLLLMIFSQYVFGTLFCFIPAFILFGRISGLLTILAMWALPSYGAWTLIRTFREMQADFQ